MDFGAITAYYNIYGLMTYRHREMTTFLQWTMLDQVMHLISGCETLQGFFCVRHHDLPSLYTHPNVWSSKMFNIFIISRLFGVWLCSPSKTKGWSLLTVALCAWSWLFPDGVASAAHDVPPERHVCIVSGEVCSRTLTHSLGNRLLLPICTAAHSSHSFAFVVYINKVI